MTKRARGFAALVDLDGAREPVAAHGGAIVEEPDVEEGPAEVETTRTGWKVCLSTPRLRLLLLRPRAQDVGDPAAEAAEVDVAEGDAQAGQLLGVGPVGLGAARPLPEDGAHAPQERLRCAERSSPFAPVILPCLTTTAGRSASERSGRGQLQPAAAGHLDGDDRRDRHLEADERDARGLGGGLARLASHEERAAHLQAPERQVLAPLGEPLQDPGDGEEVSEGRDGGEQGCERRGGPPAAGHTGHLAQEGEQRVPRSGRFRAKATLALR